MKEVLCGAELNEMSERIIKTTTLFIENETKRNDMDLWTLFVMGHDEHLFFSSFQIYF